MRLDAAVSNVIIPVALPPPSTRRSVSVNGGGIGAPAGNSALVSAIGGRSLTKAPHAAFLVLVKVGDETGPSEMQLNQLQLKIQ